MKAIIKIEMDNAAFENGNSHELARILHSLSGRIEEYTAWHGGDSLQLSDINGNTVGSLNIKE